jgi:hypothetical protein
LQVDFAFHAIAGTIIGKSADVNLGDTPDAELESIALPRTVNVATQESFAGQLRFWFYPDEKAMFLENTMDRSPGTQEIELALDPSGSPTRIFPFEPDNPLFQ